MVGTYTYKTELRYQQGTGRYLQGTVLACSVLCGTIPLRYVTDIQTPGVKGCEI